MVVVHSGRALVRSGWFSVAALLVMAIGSPISAAEKPAEQKKPAATAESTSDAAQAKKPSGRLPNYYAEVVTPEQRKTIVDIQAEYKAKTDVLQTQIAQLTKEKTDKIEALLTPDQKKKLADLKAAATAKRKASKGTTPAASAEPAKTTEEAKPAPAAEPAAPATSRSTRKKPTT